MKWRADVGIHTSHFCYGEYFGCFPCAARRSHTERADAVHDSLRLSTRKSSKLQPLYLGPKTLKTKPQKYLWV